MDIKIGDGVCYFSDGRKEYFIGTVNKISSFSPQYHIIWNDTSESWERTETVEEYRDIYLDFLNK